MILLNPVVQVLTGSVQHFTAKDAMNFPWIRRVFVGGHAIRFVANSLDSLLEECFSGLQITFFAQHRIDQVPGTVNSTVQIAPVTLDLHVRLVHIPRFSACPRRLARNCFVSYGVKRASQSRTVSWLKS